jgi:hypothetical protein
LKDRRCLNKTQHIIPCDADQHTGTVDGIVDTAKVRNDERHGLEDFIRVAEVDFKGVHLCVLGYGLDGVLGLGEAGSAFGEEGELGASFYCE